MFAKRFGGSGVVWLCGLGLCLGLGVVGTRPAAAQSVRAAPAADELPAAAVARFAELALACVGREYPNKIAHVMTSDADALPPHTLTPAFFGCFDWHSAVHGHWLLVRLLRRYPQAPWAARARAALHQSLTAKNLQAEAAYLNGAQRTSFERPYGLAWLLQLSAELGAEIILASTLKEAGEILNVDYRTVNRHLDSLSEEESGRSF